MRATLTSVEAKYGVPREILVSIWGNETNYGRDTGGFNIFEALATLAYDGARTDFGRRELLAALKMVQQENLNPKNLPSSWAGAFGQLQMIPSTFLKSAVDGDGDGKRDLGTHPPMRWHPPQPNLPPMAGSTVTCGAWRYSYLLFFRTRRPMATR